MWEKFGGREQMLDAPARLVRRVRLLLSATNEYEAELHEEQKRELEAQKREMDRQRVRR